MIHIKYQVLFTQKKKKLKKKKNVRLSSTAVLIGTLRVYTAARNTAKVWLSKVLNNFIQRNQVTVMYSQSFFFVFFFICISLWSHEYKQVNKSVFS